jgi:hypothetical protein
LESGLSAFRAASAPGQPYVKRMIEISADDLNPTVMFEWPCGAASSNPTTQRLKAPQNKVARIIVPPCVGSALRISDFHRKVSWQGR